MSQSFHRQIRTGIDSLHVGRLTCTTTQPICLSSGRLTTWLDPTEAEATALALLEAAHSPLLERIEHLRDEVQSLAEQLHSAYEQARSEVCVAWKRCTDDLPDDNSTVLIAHEDGEIFVAYIEAGQWLDIHGGPMDAPACWADLPSVPEHLLSFNLEETLAWVKTLPGAQTLTTGA